MELAQRLGASVHAVSRWEQGQTRPIWRYRRHLANLFGVKVAEIAFGPADQPPQERP
jgi:transcriptional regulator with XRE-family HTH domain